MSTGEQQGSDLTGKLKQANTQVSSLQRQLQDERAKRQSLEEDAKWNKDLTGDDAQAIRQRIVDANLEITRREEELKTREEEVSKSQLGADATRIAAECGIEVTELEGLETAAEMTAKGLQLQNTKLKEDWTKLEEMKKEGGNYEHGGASGGTLDIPNMPKEDFEAHVKKEKAKALAG